MEMRNPIAKDFKVHLVRAEEPLKRGPRLQHVLPEGCALLECKFVRLPHMVFIDSHAVALYRLVPGQHEVAYPEVCDQVRRRKTEGTFLATDERVPLVARHPLLSLVGHLVLQVSLADRLASHEVPRS